jgi:preprotein translocase subunit YajC
VLIPQAFAQGAPATGGADWLSLLPLILIFVLFYFMLIRPQMKRAKEHKAMIEALQKGDEVVTAGGTIGRITKVGDGYVTLQVADNVEIQVQKQSIQLLLPKGTFKSVKSEG